MRADGNARLARRRKRGGHDHCDAGPGGGRQRGRDSEEEGPARQPPARSRGREARRCISQELSKPFHEGAVRARDLDTRKNPVSVELPCARKKIHANLLILTLTGPFSAV